jgi:hypothetical protein
MKPQTIILPIFEIVVEIFPGGCATITSNLKKGYGSKSNYDPPINVAIDVVESLILAHACAGIDITDRRYQEGIKTTVEKIVNVYS